MKIETANHLLPHNRESFKLLMEMKDQFKTLLDIGAGERSPFDKILVEAGVEVETVDFLPGATYTGDYMDLKIDKKYDAILCYNCAEHQLNLNSFLRKLHENLKDDGILAISVPIWKDRIVDGHIVAFPNAGLFLYNLIMAGWDCSNAKVATLTISEPPPEKIFEEQIAVIIKRARIVDFPKDLSLGKGDLGRLKRFFPEEIRERMTKGKDESFEGSIGNLRINWSSKW